MTPERPESPAAALFGKTLGYRARSAWSTYKPVPKVAAGLLTFAILAALSRAGVEPEVLGLSAKPLDALITFAVMWAWPDRAVVIETPEGHERLGVTHATAQAIAGDDSRARS